MNRDSIIQTARSCEARFKQISAEEPYQLRGILNSEALLTIAVAEHFGVTHIIESGRARGHSTNLLAKYFSEHSNTTITSIDLDKHSADAQYSESYLQKYTNLELRYGNAFTVLPQCITRDCIVFIDGPKGEAALNLTSQLLADTRVKAVLVHDLHQNVFPRTIAESIYQNTFFSDDPTFVEHFEHLDTDCWRVMEGTGYAPYVRDGVPVLSYGHTLGAIFNSDQPYIEPAHSNYQAHRVYNQPTIKKLVRERIMNVVHQLRLLR